MTTMDWAQIEETVWRVQAPIYMYTVQLVTGEWDVWHTRYGFPRPHAVKLGLDRRPIMEFQLLRKIASYPDAVLNQDAIEAMITDYESGVAIDVPTNNEPVDPMYFI